MNELDFNMAQHPKHKTVIENNRRKLEIALKDWTPKELESLLSKLQSVLESKRDILDETKEKRQRIEALLAENGITEDDLIEVYFSAKEPKFVRPAKYRYQDPANGEWHSWAGVGRTPIVLQRLLDEGADIDDFLIDKEDS
ncbi:H-NS family nucleoid-associated regulatory protein [Enterovibrio paralichthyis]|uniref:H-NS histone family protein n=1 Tax=Enterovibrio paralichthyis TaxID=2853805 RepID=UPI001C48B991|nr:H-NS family nucleoid-associated regulatory protein [Enterovibrio paralichthyis]MBV7300741.1 H-NS histone family protein [Enterovibrio paralichthyis]